MKGPSIRNSSVKISTYTGFKLNGASWAAAAPGDAGLLLLLPAALLPAGPAPDAVLPGTGDGLLLLPPLDAAGPLLLPALVLPAGA